MVAPFASRSPIGKTLTIPLPKELEIGIDFILKIQQQRAEKRLKRSTDNRSRLG